MKKYLTNKSSETFKLGEDFAKNLKNGDVVLLTGDLGAGKTTFVQGVAKGLGVKDKILSPTFVLVRNHTVNLRNINTLNHIDLYRIEKPKALASLGIEEFINQENSVTIIEWADRLLDYKSNKAYRIKFEHIDIDKRKVQIEKI